MVANLASKRDPEIARNSRISWENWDFPSPKLRFSMLKIWFSSTAFQFPRNPRKSYWTAFWFLQRLSVFFDAFLLSVKAFKFLIFLNGFPIFFNAFPLSKKSGKIYLWRQVHKRLPSELCISAKIAISCDKIIGGKNTKDHYPSFVFSVLIFVILANYSPFTTQSCKC